MSITSMVELGDGNSDNDPNTPREAQMSAGGLAERATSIHTPYMLDYVRETTPTICEMLHPPQRLPLKAAARYYAQNVRVPEGRLYICGGCVGRTTSEVECFNHRLGLWVRMSPMSEPRCMHTGAIIDGQLYVVGGRTVDDDGQNGQLPGVRMNTMERFNPDRDEWERMTPMSTARVFHSASVIAGKLYIVGGVNPMMGLDSVECFNPQSEEWRILQPMTTRRCLHTASVIGRQLYVVGGSSGLVPWQPEDTEDSMERFDPEKGRWEILEPLSLGRYVHTATVMSGCLYIVGGKHGSVALNLVERYDPVTRTWEELASLLMPRRFHTASVIGGKLYVVGGGEFNMPTNSVERFNPESGRWQRVASMSEPRMLHSASVIDGKLHVVGGVDRDTAERFNPKMGIWEDIPLMFRTHRFYHSASFIR